jgi:hypothetical protein
LDSSPSAAPTLVFILKIVRNIIGRFVGDVAFRIVIYYVLTFNDLIGFIFF